MKRENSWQESKCEKEDVRCWMLDVGRKKRVAAEARGKTKFLTYGSG